ncbi:MAG: hypothetical protein LBS10_01580 [Gracilibacteraceae bacterium]|jgi:hypothetical protein|nr:hypothetical protein [Gracilibacteraceae bacterium]
MGFILNHWHCIIPVIGIIIAMIIMREKPKDDRSRRSRVATRQVVDIQEEVGNGAK